MPLSEEAERRFTEYVDHTNLADTTFGHDDALLGFAAWALVHEPAALQETFSLDGIMSGRGIDQNKRRFVHAILGAALPLIVAYEHEREG